MSLEYEAFTQFHRARYLRYAQTRTSDPAAAALAVEEAFSDLAAIWGEVLRSPNPAAIAWPVLRQAVERCSPPPTAATVFHFLPPGHADAVVLHHGLGLPLAETAELMGIDISALRARLAASGRLLGTHSPGPTADGAPRRRGLP
jgi:DNA-directed RNA polymerase specialized sigma24 family protein